MTVSTVRPTAVVVAAVVADLARSLAFRRPFGRSLGFAWLRPNAGDQTFVLVKNRAPPVILVDIGLPLTAHGGAERRVPEQQLERLDELIAIRVKKPRIALAAVRHED